MKLYDTGVYLKLCAKHNITIPIFVLILIKTHTDRINTDKNIPTIKVKLIIEDKKSSIFSLKSTKATLILFCNDIPSIIDSIPTHEENVLIIP